MKTSSYIKDRILSIILFVLSIILIVLILAMTKIKPGVIVLIILLIVLPMTFVFLRDYYKRKKYYEELIKIVRDIDKKYLITEMIKDCNFLDGKIFLEQLRIINKSMHEEVNNYKYNINEFKEYLELWCHEIKTPVATSKLIIENNDNKITQSILEEINKIDNYIEQVLYYSRSENVEKDYIISNINLIDVVNNVIKRNKKDLINKKIKILIDDLDYVNSDSKWLEFILNQILTNSIKYSCSKEPYIKIKSIRNKNNVVLFIEDNGIGIEETEIDKVFDKGFTGTNGRKKYSSTGIGLYLCKKLCKKLDHEIEIESKINEYTMVSIIFPMTSLIKKD